MGGNCLGGICQGVYIWGVFVWGIFVLEPREDVVLTLLSYNL